MAGEGIVEMSGLSEWLARRDEGEEKARCGSKCHLEDWQKDCTISHSETGFVWVSKKEQREGTWLFIRITTVACLNFSFMDSSQRYLYPIYLYGLTP